MDVISKAIDECKFQIPRQILEVCFNNRDQYYRLMPTSIDEHIRNEVLKPRVLVDCNLVGGTEIFVPLAGLQQERINDYTSVYKIPKNRTQNRTILSVLNITFSNPNMITNYGISSQCGNSTMLQGGQQVMDAMGSIPITSTAYVQLIGENVVMVRDTVILPANIYLRCIVQNDENMSHIQLRSYRAFAKLAVLAVKAYIYNEMIVRMDQGELYAGQELGIIKSKIEEYADSEELYQTYMTEVWQKVAFMNDRETYNRFKRILIGGPH